MTYKQLNDAIEFATNFQNPHQLIKTQFSIHKIPPRLLIMSLKRKYDYAYMNENEEGKYITVVVSPQLALFSSECKPNSKTAAQLELCCIAPEFLRKTKE